MPCDLLITRIGLPPRLVAPCRIQVEVDVTNAGPDPAELPFDVELSFPIGADDDGRGPRYVETLKSAEGTRLMAGQTVTLPFMVSLPCRIQMSARAIADSGRAVLDNARTQPSLTVPVGPVDLLPWIQASVRVGLENAARLVTWNPTELCPGANALVEVEFRNRGCVASGSFSVQLDVAGQSSVLAVGAIATGGISARVFLVKAPTTPGPVTFTVTPNFSFPLCPTTGLPRSITIPVVPGGAPRLSFSVDAPVMPGQLPSVTWRLDNDCDELGDVTAEVSFSGTVLYRSAPQPTRLRASVGETSVRILPAAVTPAIASAFWAFGTRPLDLALTATGRTAPFMAQAQLEIVPEGAAGALGFVFGPRGGAPWKASYLVDGFFTNRSGFSAMTVTAVALREHLSTDATPAADKLVTLTPATFGTMAPAALSIRSGSFFSQSWTWADPVTCLASGTARTYVYTTEFTFSDAFANVYPLRISSPPLSVTITVSTLKQSEAVLAASFRVVFVIALGAAIALFIYAATLPYPANLIPGIAGAVCMTIAVAALGASIWRKQLADDPPLPDLDYHERVSLEPPPRVPFDLELSARPAFSALESLLALLERVQSSDQAMHGIHRKLLGARLDGDARHQAIQARDFRAAQRVFETATALLPDVVAELAPALRADELLTLPLDETLHGWRERGIPREVEEKWMEAGHPADALKLADEIVRRREQLPDNLLEPLNELLAGLHSMASTRRDWAREVLRLADE